MAKPHRSEEVTQLLKNGGVVLFKNNELLGHAVSKLQELCYCVREIDCLEHSNEESALLAIVDALKIPRYETINLDGFNDFISQVEFDNFAGVALVLHNYDNLHELDPTRSTYILDILANKHRLHLLYGDLFFTLVQTNDTDLDQSIGTIGGYLPPWNNAEWFRKNRDLN